MNAVHFGAGNIGRGLIGYLIKKDNYNLTFIDTQTDVVEDLNKHGYYEIEIIDKEKTVERIKDVQIINSLLESDKVLEALANADLITTSIGTTNLHRIVPTIIKAMKIRKDLNKLPVDIIANENSINASSYLKDLIIKACEPDDLEWILTYLGFKNSAIDRQALSTVINSRKTASVEAYYEWIIEEGNSSNNNRVRISSAKYVDNMQYYIERKLLCVNAGHASAAYLGFSKGLKTVQEALADKECRTLVQETILENAQYISNKYDESMQSLHQFSEVIIARHGNPLISDSVMRVGQNPIRKLSKGERLTSAIEYLFEQGHSIDALATTIASALRFDVKDDEESVRLQSMIKDLGLEDTLKQVTVIKEQSIINLIMDKYETTQE